MSLIDRLLQRVTEAGAPRESSHKRNGFLSHHEESHALGACLGLGFAIGVAGDLSVVGVLLSLILYGTRGDDLLEPRLVGDILAERHYAIAGLAVGILVGVGVGRVVTL